MAATPDDQNHDEHTGVAGNLPTPVAAALGIVVSGVRTAKNLPTIAPQLPLIGMAFVAQKAQTVRREYLGYAGRRVLVSRKWSGKTLADHRADRKEWLLRTLGVSATDPARYAWEPVAPTDQDHLVS